MNNILLLEDDLTAGETYKGIIEDSIPQTKVIWVTNISDAKDEISHNAFQVIIVDQKLGPAELGTDFLSELSIINNESYKIMLSGEATRDTVSDALDRHLDDYLNKENIEKLIPKIVNGLARYEQRMSNKVKKLLYTYKPKRFLFKKNKVYLVNVFCSNNNFVFEDQWEDEARLDAGIRRDMEYTYKFKNSLDIKFDINTDVKSTFGLDSLKLKQNLEVGLNFVARLEESVEKELAITETITHNLPDIPEDVTQKHIINRTYKWNQVFQEYEVLLGIECFNCSKMDFIKIKTYRPTMRIKRKCETTYNDGSKDSIDLGISLKKIG